MHIDSHEPLTVLEPSCVLDAHRRIKAHINETPILKSEQLNDFLGHEIFFKYEGQQKVGAFKARGALNALLSLKEQGKAPKEVVAFSSGNHSQAVAWASQQIGAQAIICVPSEISKVKLQATKAYGAKVLIADNRQEAEEQVKEFIDRGAYFLHPYDNDHVIAGQGTACYEALSAGIKADAIFATCGGGGWVSGSYLAAQLLRPEAKVFAAEPLNANDAAQSIRNGTIYKFEKSPETIADGARTLYVAERTFQYLQKMDGIYEASEDEIIYWTQWLSHLLKAVVEPTSATSMAAACKWLKEQSTKQTVLIMLSGGNIGTEKQQVIWQKDYLEQIPCLN